MIKKYMIGTLLLSVSIFKAMPIKIYVGREKARKVREFLQEREERHFAYNFAYTHAPYTPEPTARGQEIEEEPRKFLPADEASIEVDSAVEENKSAKPSRPEKQKKKKAIKAFVMV